MRTNICRYLLILALLPLLLLGCAAWQEESEASGRQTDEMSDRFLGEDWKARFIELGMGGEGKMLGFARTKTGLYAAFTKTSEGAEEYPLYYLSDRKLGKMESEQNFESMFVEMPVEHQPFNLFSDEDKSLFILASCYTEEADSYFLYAVDTEEWDVQHADITMAWKEAFGEESYNPQAAVDENGFVYMGARGMECNILVLQRDGSLVSILLQQDVILHDLANIGGQIYCAGRSQGTDVLYRIDSQHQKLEMVAELPDNRGTVMLRPGQDNTVLYGYYDAVYQYDPEKGEGRDIYGWAHAGMDGANIKNFFMDEKGKIWVLPDLKEEILVMLLLQNPSEESENEPITEKETVIICGDKVRDTELKKAVGAFNIANDKYHVEIMEYDYDRLVTEIVTGNGPDLIPLGVTGVSVAANKDIVEDLTPYLEASQILSRDMLNERVLDLYTVEEKLTCIPPSFCVITLFGKKSELGSEPGWTMEEFLDYVDGHRGLTVMEGIMQGDSRMIMMMMMWYARQQQWVDWKQGKAKFDEGEFEELMRFAAAYEAKYDGDSDGAEKKWQEDKLLLYSRPVISVKSYLQYREILAGDMMAIGYPTQEGTPCNMLSGYGIYGISAASAHKRISVEKLSLNPQEGSYWCSAGLLLGYI